MDIIQAFKHLSENFDALLTKNSKILGVAHTPNDPEAEFYIIELSLDEDAKKEENINYFNVYLEGGNIPGNSGFDDQYNDENIENLMSEIPEFAKNISYQIIELDNCIFGIESIYALKSIFPSLPDPDLSDIEHFKNESISTIRLFNAEYS